MQYILGALVFVLVIGIIICVHEGGHFFFARRAKILCREFAFGMGPILLKKKKGETLYTLRAFPIGGFCAIAGEEVEEDPLKTIDKVRLEIVDGVIKKIYLNVDDEAVNDIPLFTIKSHDLFDEKDTGNLFIEIEDGTIYKVDPQALFVDKKMEIQIAPHNRTLNAKSKRARALTMFGGPMMNFILALVVFFLAGLIYGKADFDSTKLGWMEDKTPAYDFGLRNDDVITSLQSGGLFVKVNEWEDISKFMDDYTLQYPSSKIIVNYMRDRRSKTISIQPIVIINTIGLFSDYKKDGVIVGDIDKNSKAYKAGLRYEDEIVQVNGNDVVSWKTVYDAFYTSKNTEKVTLKVKNNNKLITVTPYSFEVLKSQNAEPVYMSMGLSASTKFDLGFSFEYAGKRTLSSMTLVFTTLKLLFTSNEVGTKDLGGVVTIFTLSTQVAQQGIISILNLIGLLSVNVGLLNLLPIPALDGGRLAFLGYEAITKKKPTPKVETAMIGVTFFLLLGLMVYVTYNDIARLIQSIFG